MDSSRDTSKQANKLLKKETILMAKEETVIAMMPKSEVMTTVEMSKSATAQNPAPSACHRVLLPYFEQP